MLVNRVQSSPVRAAVIFIAFVVASQVYSVALLSDVRQNLAIQPLGL